MLITKETDYALRILRTLSEGGCHTVGALAAREALPRNFAYKIVKKLERGHRHFEGEWRRLLPGLRSG